MAGIKLIECPRDAMQGIATFISTEDKVRYINQLLKVGFDTIDFGSFVSPKAIPQMRDTKDVLLQLDLSRSNSKLLAIVANERGAREAASYDEITYLGYPFSVSETFQLRNTNATIEDSLERLKSIRDIALKQNKQLVVYISMGFGNPYGDPWNVDIVESWSSRLAEQGVGILSLSDTIGVATPESIEYLFSNLISALPDVEFGAHLHTTIDRWKEKVDAAYKNGCKRFDGAIKGYGGCPMAKDELTGNMPMEMVIYYIENEGINLEIDHQAFNQALVLAGDIFPS